jgi:hypothetical protein
MEPREVVVQLWSRIQARDWIGVGELAEGSTVVSEVRVPHPVVGPYFALSFFLVDEGLIRSAREYWVAESYEEPPAERAHWFEPM